MSRQGDQNKEDEYDINNELDIEEEHKKKEAESKLYF